jgi:ribosomal protein S12 methylthiotransferase accessory factor
VGVSTELWGRLSAETSPAAYRFGTRRAVSPAETLRRIRPLLGRAGITRLADVTGLDRIGIPVYQAIRPNSRNLSVSQGKGLTRAQARVSALMEALEGFHAEELGQPGVRETVGAMRRLVNYDPYELTLSEPSVLNDATPLDWVAATDLCNGGRSWVPRALCELNYCVEERYHVPLFRPTSNGLASGNTTAEALVHGLCEVVERDAIWRNVQAGAATRPGVAPETVDARLAGRVLDQFAAAGIETRIVDASGPTGLPCFEARLHDPEAPVLYGGNGCHPSRSTALLRALTEAAQSRLTTVAGSRDDLNRSHYGSVSSVRRPRWPVASGSFRDAPTVAAAPFTAQVHDITRRIRRVTGMAPLAVDLLRPELGLPVVFVVAPGLRLDPD